jgi:hypothetical protein
MPILHPRQLMMGMEVEEHAQVVYLKRALAISRSREEVHLKTDKPPWHAVVTPNLAEVKTFDAAVTGLAKRESMALVYDIESAGDYITLIGLSLVDMASEMCHGLISLPFRTQGGNNYWSEWENHCEVVRMLYTWLADRRVANVFHNGVGYDVPQLEDTGFVVRGLCFDTLIMQHYAYPEMRKGLQYCATLYCGAPVWKDLGEDEDDSK